MTKRTFMKYIIPLLLLSLASCKKDSERLADRYVGTLTLEYYPTGGTRTEVEGIEVDIEQKGSRVMVIQRRPISGGRVWVSTFEMDEDLKCTGFGYRDNGSGVDTVDFVGSGYIDDKGDVFGYSVSEIHPDLGNGLSYTYEGTAQ